MAGRGRGRGRGRGQPMMPRLTDDEGNTISTADIGPPPLFPAVELPSAPELEALDERLVERWNSLQQAYKRSPYHLGPARPSAGAVGSVTSFGRSQNDAQEHAKALARVMILDGRYFPQELYSDKERKFSSIAATPEAQKAYFEAEARKSDRDAPILERLARLETQFEAGSPRKGEAAEGGEKKKTEDGEPDEDEPIEEDEDDYQEEDDYYQGNVYDDDEEYGDTLDDGGDDGAIY